MRCGGDPGCRHGSGNGSGSGNRNGSGNGNGNGNGHSAPIAGAISTVTANTATLPHRANT